MRTTLKRGIGRGAALNGNGRAVLPPSALSEVTRYRQPPPPRHGLLHSVVHALAWLALAIVVAAAGALGGVYLYTTESIARTAPKSADELAATKRLDVAAAGEPATALVIGYDKRAGVESELEARSDTVMLVRADPDADAISLLSFPRDLIVDVHCPRKVPFAGKINEAYTLCGAEGTLETVRQLTGLPIHYLITVNFRGFTQIVAKLGGVWVDVDRRYFNDNSSGENYAAIDVQPGYQRLNGSDALDFVRYRHSDSDLYRLARQQLFVRSFTEAVKASLSPTDLPGFVKTITKNVVVGRAGGGTLSIRTLWSYGLLAYELPDGHFFQTKIEGLTGYAELSTDPANIEAAVARFANPDVDAPEKATAVALGRKPPAATGPRPDAVTLTVLNGNGVDGSAANASYLLGRLGYRVGLPANGAPADAPTYGYPRTKVYYDPDQADAKLAAGKVAEVFGEADVEPLLPQLRPLAGSAMLVAVVGKTFNGSLARTPLDETPERQKPAVRNDPGATLPLLREARQQVGFPLVVPHVLEENSFLDRSVPIRVYEAAGRRAVRLVFDTGRNEFWGIQMTSWTDAPLIAEPNKIVTIGGRRFELHYSGPKLHMVVLRENGASYWVINTLLDGLSNETMLAIAKGLRPVRG